MWYLVHLIPRLPKPNLRLTADRSVSQVSGIFPIQGSVIGLVSTFGGKRTARVKVNHVRVILSESTVPLRKSLFVSGSIMGSPSGVRRTPSMLVTRSPHICFV